jgi:hypothetical protein
LKAACLSSFLCKKGFFDDKKRLHVKFFSPAAGGQKNRAIRRIFSVKPPWQYAAENRIDRRWLLSVRGFYAMVTPSGGNIRFNAADGREPQFNFF